MKIGPFFFNCIIVLAAVLLLQSCSVSKQISKQAQAVLIHDSIISTGHIGISVYEPSSQTYWYNYNADKYFVPASNTKLFTLYAGMKYLGDSLVGLRYRENDTAITIYPCGDPSFLHPAFSKQQASVFLTSIPKNKDVLIGGDIFAPFGQLAKGWAWDDYQEKYMTKRTPMPMYGGLVTVRALDSFNIQFEPKYFKKKMYGQTIGDKPSFELFKKFDTNDIMISWGTGTDTFKQVPFNTDFETILDLLDDTFHLNINRDFFGRMLTKDPLLLKGRNYDDFNSKEIKRIHSQPTDSLLTPMMHNSDNFFAEQTLLMASNEHLGYMNDEAIIDTLLKTDLKDVSQKPNWVDGSGLSRYNQFTPQSFIYILNKMKDEFGMERLKTILPTGGEGTLKNYYQSDSGFIYAKTGSLSGQVALSGFLITKQNKLLVFSLLANNVQGSGSAVRRAFEHFLHNIRAKY